MSCKIGLLTIGQAPRRDILPELRKYNSKETVIEFSEAGALDDLSNEEIAQLEPPEGADRNVLITRLRNGESVRVLEDAIMQLLLQKAESLFVLGAERVILLCAGQFPVLEHMDRLVFPDRLLMDSVVPTAKGRALGIITPLAEQVEESELQFAVSGAKTVRTEPASPYSESALDEVKRAALALKTWGAESIAMECLGYTSEMSSVVADLTGVRVITVRDAINDFLWSYSSSI